MTISYSADIAALFRDKDRTAMLRARNFDLAKYADVVLRADAILVQVSNGSMPCDQAWPEEKVKLFAQWISDGKLP